MTKGFTKLMSFISYPAKVFSRSFDDIAAWKQVVKEEAMRVPTFYGAETGSYPRIQQWFIVLFVSVMFAFVHFLAGLSAFPTLNERIVWFSSTFAILFVPMLFWFTICQWYQEPKLIAKFSPLLVGIYILARIFLFVLGFTTLRCLPPGALDTIHWPNFILVFTGN
jgi:hypothetical protein